MTRKIMNVEVVAGITGEENCGYNAIVARNSIMQNGHKETFLLKNTIYNKHRSLQKYFTIYILLPILW